MKFGGTSVADSERILRAANIVTARVKAAPVVVVSALGGVTDLLVDAVEAAQRDRREELEPQLAELERRHRWSVEGCVRDAGRRHDLNLALDATFDELRQLLRSVRFLGEVTPRARDTLLAFGELLSSRILCAALDARGVAAEWVDPRRVVKTDDVFGQARPRSDELEAACRDHLATVVERGAVPVTGGFVGSSPDGHTTTLGRGGSDTTAALLGAALRAEEIQIWTDVDGMMTADPRVVPGARTLARISFAEATELSLYGAKVLHPASVESAIRRDIPVRILNAARPDAAGTSVTSIPDDGRRGFAAVACRGGVAMVRVDAPGGRVDIETLAAVLDACRESGARVEAAVATETGVLVAVHGEKHAQLIADRSAPVGTTEILTGRAVVCLVGHGLGRDPAARAEALHALASARCEVVAAGSSPHSLTAIVSEEDLAAIAAALHAHLFEEFA